MSDWMTFAPSQIDSCNKNHKLTVRICAHPLAVGTISTYLAD